MVRCGPGKTSSATLPHFRPWRHVIADAKSPTPLPNALAPLSDHATQERIAEAVRVNRPVARRGADATLGRVRRGFLRCRVRDPNSSMQRPLPCHRAKRRVAGRVLR